MEICANWICAITEFLESNRTFFIIRPENLATRDAVLWMSIHHSEKKACEIFAKEIASAGTGMAPGLTTVISGRPKPAPRLHFWSYLVPKNDLQIKIQTSDGHLEVWVDNSAHKRFSSVEELENEPEFKSSAVSLQNFAQPFAIKLLNLALF